MKQKILLFLIIAVLVGILYFFQKNKTEQLDTNVCHPDTTNEETMKNFDKICEYSGGKWVPPCMELVYNPKRLCNVCICPYDKICDSEKGCI